MHVLYHLWLCPFARKVRIVLGEKKVDFELRSEKVWERREGFLALNPAGEVPVLVETDEANATQRTLVDSSAICEYLEETRPEPPLLGDTPEDRAEVRRIGAWFDLKFYREVTVNLVDEKINKRFLGLGHPSSTAIRAGYTNLETHLGYISWLMERRNWLAGDVFSMADVAAAAQISCIDYLGDVPWDAWPEVKNWYARVKSRPSLRPLLADHIPGAPPPKHYADLDF